MTFDLSPVVDALSGAAVPKPGGEGAIAGHAAGEPFDKLITRQIGEVFPNRTFRQFEVLNAVLKARHEATTAAERLSLLGPPALQRLLKRGKEPMRNWSEENQFDEKQNDTADIIVLPTQSLDLHVGPVHLVDAKTYQEERQGQPPNIISALKLAHMCKDMIDSDNFGSHDISYLSVAWVLDGEELRVTDSTSVALFREDPENLYINWAAAHQIQFHPHRCQQSFGGSTEDWCRGFLGSFVASARNRIESMRTDFVKEFEEYT